MSARYLDDFRVGERFETAPVTLAAREIVDFAEKYDPQPMHMDPLAAAAGEFGGLIASGFQTVALGFAQFVRLGLLDGTSLGGPGMDEVRWHLPVHAGDTLLAVAEVVQARPSRSNPDRGVLQLHFQVNNQAGKLVCSFRTVTIIRRRP